jgi:hypothetical protein
MRPRKTCPDSNTDSTGTSQKALDFGQLAEINASTASIWRKTS